MSLIIHTKFMICDSKFKCLKVKYIHILLCIGLLKIGDCIVEVNNEDVGHMTLEDLQDLLVSQPRPPLVLHLC